MYLLLIDIIYNLLVSEMSTGQFTLPKLQDQVALRSRQTWLGDKIVPLLLDFCRRVSNFQKEKSKAMQYQGPCSLMFTSTEKHPVERSLTKKHSVEYETAFS